VTSVGADEHIIDQGLHADLHGLYPVLLKKRKNLFTEGIRPGRNADGINAAGGKIRLNFIQAGNLVFWLHGRETASVKGHLPFSVPMSRGDLLK
jgi:hypothetical protein